MAERITKYLYRAGRRYYYVRRVVGSKKVRWEPLDAQTESQALRELASRLEAPGDIRTVDDLLLAHEKKRSAKLAEGTYRNYLVSYKRLRAVFGGMRPDDVEPGDVGRYLEEMTSPSAANRDIAVLSGAYRYGLKIGAAQRNPCRGVEPAEEPTRDRYVTDAEFLAVNTFCLARPQWAALAYAQMLSYTTGLRENEVLRVHKSDWDAQFLYVRAEKKTGHRARVEMTAELRALLDETAAGLTRKVGSVYLLTSRKATPYTKGGFTSAWARMQRAALDAGVLAERYRFQDIRAKHATDRDEAGLNAQLALGHPDPATTARYIRSKKGRKFAPMPLPRVEPC